MRSPPADRCPITHRRLERFPAAYFAKSRGRGSSGHPRPACDGRSRAYPAGGQVAWWDQRRQGTGIHGHGEHCGWLWRDNAATDTSVDLVSQTRLAKAAMALTSAKS